METRKKRSYNQNQVTYAKHVYKECRSASVEEKLADRIKKMITENGVRDLDQVTCKQIRENGIDIKHEALINLKMKWDNVSIYMNEDMAITHMSNYMAFCEEKYPRVPIDYKYFFIRISFSLSETDIRLSPKPTQNMNANNRKDISYNSYMRYVYKSNKEVEDDKTTDIFFKPSLHKPVRERTVPFSPHEFLDM